MKKLIGIIIAASIAVFSAQAENVALGVGSPTTLQASTNMTAGATVNNNTVIALPSSSNIAFQLNVAGASATATGTVTATLLKSVDGVNYSSFATIPVTESGTSTATTITNLTSSAFPFIKCTTIVEAGSATNVTVSAYFYSKKGL
jgi:hypothetical protein